MMEEEEEELKEDLIKDDSSKVMDTFEEDDLKHDDLLVNGLIKNNSDLKSDTQESPETASSGYDSCPLSPSTTGSNSPRTTDEIIIQNNEEINSTGTTAKMQINVIPPSTPLPTKIKKTGKNFPTLIPIKKKRIKLTSSSTTKVKDDNVLSPAASSSSLIIKSPSKSLTKDNDNKNDDDAASSSDNEVSNIPLSQRLKSLKKKKTLTRFRLKQSKADRDILNAMENPKASTSGPLRREMERFRRANAEGGKKQVQPPPISTPTLKPYRRIISRSRQIGSPLKKSPFKIQNKNSPTTAAKKLPLHLIKKKKLKLTKSPASVDNKTTTVKGNNDDDVDAEDKKDDDEMPILRLEQQNLESQEEDENEKTDKDVDIKKKRTKKVRNSGKNMPVLQVQQEKAVVQVNFSLPKENSLVRNDATTVANNNGVVENGGDIKVQKKLLAVQLQRDDNIELLLRAKIKQQEEEKNVIEESRKSNSQSDSESVAVTVDAPKSKSQPGPKRKKRAVAVKKNKSASTDTIKKETESPRLIIKLERLSNDSITKLSSTPGSQSSNHDNSRKRKVCQVSISSSDSEALEVDVVGFSSAENSETDDFAIYPDPDAPAATKNGGVSSQQNTKSKVTSKWNNGLPMPVSRQHIKPGPKSQTTTTTRWRKADPKSYLKINDDDDANFISTNGSTSYNGNYTNSTLITSKNDVTSSLSTTTTQENTIDSGRRRVSGRQKKLRVDDYWFY